VTEDPVGEVKPGDSFMSTTSLPTFHSLPYEMEEATRRHEVRSSGFMASKAKCKSSKLKI